MLIMDPYPESLRDLNLRIATSIHSAGIMAQDLLPIFQKDGRDLRTWQLPPFGGHGSAKANALVAGISVPEVASIPPTAPGRTHVRWLQTDL